MKTVDFLNICAPSSPNRWNQLHTALNSRSTLHIRKKFQWTSEQPLSWLKSLRTLICNTLYFHRRSSKFPAEHLALLLEWFKPFLIRHNSSCTVFWVSSFYLSVNIVVLYQSTVTCIENLAAKVEAGGLLDGKKVQGCHYQILTQQLQKCFSTMSFKLFSKPLSPLKSQKQTKVFFKVSRTVTWQ